MPMLKELALVHEGDAIAALGFVQVRRGDEDGEAVGREMRQGVPELAARDRIDAGGGLVEQQHTGAAEPERRRATAFAACRR